MTIAILFAAIGLQQVIILLAVGRIRSLTQDLIEMYKSLCSVLEERAKEPEWYCPYEER